MGVPSLGLGSLPDTNMADESRAPTKPGLSLGGSKMPGLNLGQVSRDPEPATAKPTMKPAGLGLGLGRLDLSKA